MLVIRSDFSPSAAAEPQEEDNLDALIACLYLAGMDSRAVGAYMAEMQNSTVSYAKALQGDDGKGQDWDAAAAAAKPHQAIMSQMLKDSGVTIENTLVKSKEEGYYSHIETKVWRDQHKKVVAIIERPVLDHEVEVYQSNQTGWGV